MAAHGSSVVAAAIAACTLTALDLYAQDFPTRPVRVIVPYAAGGGTDISTRTVQAKAMELLGQPVIVDNRAGGGTLIGTRAVQAATPDGYTLGVMDPAFIVNPAVLRDAGYDALRDFAPVTLIAAVPLILMIPSTIPPKSVQELVAYAKANPGKLNYGSPGAGSAGHLAAEQFRSFFDLKMSHVPYKGGGPALAAVVANEVSILVIGSNAIPLIQEGRLRGLGATSTKRLPALPAVPTFAEIGFPQVNVQTFAALVAPAATPKPVIQRLHAAFAGAVHAPEVKAKLEQLNQFPVGNTPDGLGTYLRENMARLVKVVREANIRLE